MIFTSLFFVMLLSLLSFSVKEKQSNTASRGDKMKMETSFYSSQTLNNESGDLVLINFWATYDAESRVKNVRFARLVEKYKQKPIKNANGLSMVSYSFDHYQSIFNETIAADSLSQIENVYVEEGFSSDLAKQFNLKPGQFNNVLIDAKGVVMRVNVTPEEFEQIISQS